MSLSSYRGRVYTALSAYVDHCVNCGRTAMWHRWPSGDCLGGSVLAGEEKPE